MCGGILTLNITSNNMCPSLYPVRQCLLPHFYFCFLFPFNPLFIFHFSFHLHFCISFYFNFNMKVYPFKTLLKYNVIMQSPLVFEYPIVHNLLFKRQTSYEAKINCRYFFNNHEVEEVKSSQHSF
jgi:hypothetical protein